MLQEGWVWVAQRLGAIRRTPKQCQRWRLKLWCCYLSWVSPVLPYQERGCAHIPAHVDTTLGSLHGLEFVVLLCFAA